VFTLVSGPPGATVDSANRSFQWTPGEADGPGEFDVAVRVTQGASQIEGRFHIRVTEINGPPVFEPVTTVEARPEEPLRIKFAAKDPDEPSVGVKYSISAPGSEFASATLDAQTGEFVWTPSELLSGDTLKVLIQAAEEPDGVVVSLLEVPINVAKFTDPVRQLLADLRKQGLNVQTVSGDAAAPPAAFQGRGMSLTVNGEPVTVFQYESSADLQAELGRVDTTKSEVLGQPWEKEQPLTLMQRDQFIAATLTTNEVVLARLADVLDPPVAIVRKYEPPPMEVKETPRLVAALKPLYDEKLKKPGQPRKLFTKEAYEPVRKLFADEFAQAHDVDLRAGFGTDYEEVMTWFETRRDLQEELYTAVDPQQDVVIGVMQLFNQLRKDFPKQFEKYGSLSIATSVVWDKPQGIYTYEHHANRTHSTMPTAMLAGVDNFRYLVEAESVMEGRAQYVPWEFLVHLVNHNTPAQERLWSLQNFLPSRPMFGKCYSDVPYDTVMLQTESETCKLAGMEYNLPNIRQFGGVCAMQADFAARVGKSMGVPSEYVSGQGRYGGAHAWVMWVELLAINPRSVRFTLESHGRYLGDHYYVGNLKDPHTGKGMTDRQLELKLHQVGVDAMAARHCKRIMQMYPVMAEHLEFDVADRLDYLSGAVNLNPWSEEAWTALAKLSTEPHLDKAQRQTLTKVLEQLFVNFAPFPDFTLTIFDDLISFEEDASKQIAYYYRLLDVYSAAKRPDLAFTGLLALSKLLEREDRSEEAIQALAAAVQKYAEEGQHVPKMLDRLESLAADRPNVDATLAAFYASFLPKIPQKRGDEPSKYCIEIYKRAVPIFERAGQPQLAQSFAAAARQLQGQ
jgi:hypothetical protein